MPWCEGVSGYGIDEKIDLSVNAKKLLIISGYVSAKRPYLFKSNSRPKKLAVYFKNSNITKEYSLEDSPNPQIVSRNVRNFVEKSHEKQAAFCSFSSSIFCSRRVSALM